MVEVVVMLWMVECVWCRCGVVNVVYVVGVVRW